MTAPGTTVVRVCPGGAHPHEENVTAATKPNSMMLGTVSHADTAMLLEDEIGRTQLQEGVHYQVSVI